MQVVPRVLNAEFGDGYSQRAPDGLNTLMRKWRLQFTNRDQADCDAIEAFFEAQGGCLAFSWTPPTGAAGLWICSAPDGWTRSPQTGPVASISCTFKEVPA